MKIRPLLFNISCVSKAVTAMLPAGVWSRIGSACVCVCAVLKSGGGGVRRGDEGEGVVVLTLLVGRTVWFPLLQIQNG